MNNEHHIILVLLNHSRKQNVHFCYTEKFFNEHYTDTVNIRYTKWSGLRIR